MYRIIISAVFAMIVFYVLFWIANIIWNFFERKDEDEEKFKQKITKYYEEIEEIIVESEKREEGKNDD